MNYVDHHNLQEAWKRGFWTGAGMSFIVWAAILIGCAMFVYSSDVPAQDFQGPTEPVDPRTWMFEQATHESMATISDTELVHCLPEGVQTRRCDLEPPAWKRITGVDVMKLPQ